MDIERLLWIAWEVCIATLISIALYKITKEVYVWANGWFEYTMVIVILIFSIILPFMFVIVRNTSPESKFRQNIEHSAVYKYINGFSSVILKSFELVYSIALDVILSNTHVNSTLTN
jgi:hypothetical protein